MLFETSHPYILLIIVIVIVVWCAILAKKADKFREDNCNETHSPIAVWRVVGTLLIILVIALIIMAINGRLYLNSRLPNNYVAYDVNGNRGLYSLQPVVSRKSWFRGPDKI